MALGPSGKNLVANVKLGSAFCMIGAAAPADSLLCHLSNSDERVEVRFDIDRSQFSPAISKDEPPRRAQTTVRIGPKSFTAEPMLMADGVRGFWAETAMLTTNKNGDARLTILDGARQYDGTCEDVQ